MLADESTPPDESTLLEALERYADLIDEIQLNLQERRIGRLAWEGSADRLAFCTWGRLLIKWRYAARSDRPPYSLVVRLSKDLPDLLRRVMTSPKRLLRRERQREPLHRIREFDSTCMRWVCRQPGMSLAEKAGHQRSLLAVRRFESFNTLENRVVYTLVKRTARLCHSYRERYKDNFPAHRRVQDVEALLRQCGRLLEDPLFAEIGLLESIPTPNYVLLHDDRYHAIWRLFLRVMRRQRRRQVLWDNQRDLLREMLMIAVNEFLARRTKRLYRKSGLRYDAVLLPNANNGSFLEGSCAPPFWDCRGQAVGSTSCNILSTSDETFTVQCFDNSRGRTSKEYELSVDLMRRLDEQLLPLLSDLC